VVDKTASSVNLELRDTLRTREEFPFPFRYRLRYEATSQGLHIEQSIENLSEEKMPLQLGFHPYLLVDDKSQLEFCLPVSTYEDNKSEDSGTFEGFDFSRQEIDWSFPAPSERQASLRDPKRGLRVTVCYDDSFQTLVFWTLKEQPFLCLEPWTSSRLGFPNGPDMHSVEAGEAFKASVELKGESI
jgi:galactose mutarotase-like enzyme